MKIIMYNCQRCRCCVGPCIQELKITHYRQVVDKMTQRIRIEIDKEERVCEGCWMNRGLPEFLHLWNGSAIDTVPKVRKPRRQQPGPYSGPGKYHWRKNWLE